MKILQVLLSLSLTLALTHGEATPQFFTTNGATLARTSSLRRTVGLADVAAHAKTVENGHSHVHRHESRVTTPNVARIVRRRKLLTSPAAIPTTTTIVTRAQQPQQQIFQLADGRFFAFAGNSEPVQPGQLFQTADGRFFRVTANTNTLLDLPESTQSAENSVSSIPDDSFAVVEAARGRERPLESVESTQATSNSILDTKEVRDRARERQVPFLDQLQQQTQQQIQQQQEQVAQPQQQQLVLSAPLTAANARFVATTPAAEPTATTFISHTPRITQAVPHSLFFTPRVSAAATPQRQFVLSSPLQNFATAPATTQVHTVATPLATPVATRVAAPVAPLAYSLADTVSRGFYIYDNAGVAYDF